MSDFLLLLDHGLLLLGCPMNFLASEHPLLEFVPCFIDVPHFSLVTYVKQSESVPDQLSFHPGVKCGVSLETR